MAQCFNPRKLWEVFIVTSARNNSLQMQLYIHIPQMLPEGVICAIRVSHRTVAHEEIASNVLAPS